jgi:serine/threonine protein kinase
MCDFSNLTTLIYLPLCRAKGGELQSVLDRNEIPEEEDVIRFLRQILSGLAFLHQYDIAHLDLKV